jgi:hypothetical protein
MVGLAPEHGADIVELVVAESERTVQGIGVALTPPNYWRAIRAAAALSR